MFSLLGVRETEESVTHVVRNKIIDLENDVSS